MNDAVETLEFQAEARQLLQLVIHSIYSNKDVFLRELISNASDALDKLRLTALAQPDLGADISDLHIVLGVDEEAGTLTVTDNGIGMDRDEVVDMIGTIARSGTAGLLTRLREEADPAAAQHLIGQFGVGFYSAFMVADKVTLLTRRAGAAVDSGTRWESDGGSGYTVEPVAGLPVGTSVVVHLKPADGEDGLGDYMAGWKLREIVKRYSDFIRWPIRMAAEPDPDGFDGSADDEEADPVGNDAVDAGEEDGEVHEDRRTSPTQAFETLNSMKALWARPRAEVAEGEYDEFYRQITHDWQAPAITVHMHGEGTFEYDALLFVPDRAPFDLYTREARSEVQLYVKRVFVKGDCDALMPHYLRFVKGVVDAHDLSLNISRELLQQDRQIQGVRRRLVKKVLAALKDLQAKDAGRYRQLWDQYGRAIKEGLLEDPDNADALKELLRVSSTHEPGEPTTLREYVARMKDGQEAIYYLVGESRAMVENSPHMEAFTAKGYEVLLLTDPIDEVWTGHVGDFAGHRLQSIAKGRVDLADEAEGAAATAQERQKQEQEYASLLRWLESVLAEQVKQVRLSTRLTTSAACVVGDAADMTPNLEKMYRAMGQDLPQVKRILELNPSHPVVAALAQAHAADPEGTGLAPTAELVYGAALLAEGGDLPDPARFTRLLTERLAHAL